MKRILVVCMLVVWLLLMASCGDGTSRAATAATAIEDTIRGYVTTFNAGDFTQCLTYFTDHGDEGDALAFLSYMRSLSGPLELRETKDIACATPQIAIATVVFTIVGEESTDQIRLKKVDAKWKIIWEQEQEGATEESAAIEETIRDYFAAYNAEDFAKCLTYFTDFGDEQAAQASLSLMRDFIGEMTLHGVGDITVSDQTATARVDFIFWWAIDSQEMQFKKVNGVWKIVWAQEPAQPPAPSACASPSAKIHLRYCRDSPRALGGSAGKILYTVGGRQRANPVLGAVTGSEHRRPSLAFSYYSGTIQSNGRMVG